HEVLADLGGDWPPDLGQDLLDPRPGRIEIELEVAAIDLEIALAGEADGAAQQLQVADGDAGAAQREHGMGLFEEGAVRPAQPEKLQKVEQQGQIEDAA